KVLLVDDYAPIGDLFRQLLEKQQDMRVVGEAGDAEDAVNKIKDLVPDVVLMDLSLPGSSALEATHAIRVGSPGTRVIWLEAVADDVYKSEATKAGAAGCIAKVCPGTELLNVIRSTYAQDRNEEITKLARKPD
ncbi:MAG: hypothetical protein COS88_05520, partial [Chloroflexi bacterium CG07_land_8_20_14_0_80_51_10]